MKENRKDKLLKLWKMRQEAEGIDVSSVNTLSEAEHFFDEKPATKKGNTKKATKPATNKIILEVEDIEMPDIPEINTDVPNVSNENEIEEVVSTEEIPVVGE